MKLFTRRNTFLLVIFILIYSCSGDTTFEIKTEGESYLRTKHYRTYSEQQIKNILTVASTLPEYSQAASLIDEIVSGVEVKSIEYFTKLGDENVEIDASGLICHPSEPGSYPVICFQNGTNTLHSEAPTTKERSAEDVDLFFILESISSMGFIVLIPDYPGFGSSSNIPHPYLVKDYTVPALKDMILASREYIEKDVTDVAFNNQLFIMGYSQGAWATLHLQNEIENSGLEPFVLTASSCGAGPYGISTIFGSIPDQTEISQPYFFAYMMNAYNEYGQLGEELDLKGIFNEPYATKIPRLFNGQYSPSQINDSLSTDVFELINLDYKFGITDPENETYNPLRLSYVYNDVKAWKLKSKTRLYHGTEDEVVPFQLSEKMVTDFKSKGTDPSIIELKTMGGLGHTDAAIPFGLSTINWFVDLKN